MQSKEIISEVSPYLQTIAKQIQLYLNDINHFITKINNFPVPKNLLVVTMNIKLLYTSISNNEGIAAIKRKCNNYPQKNYMSKIYKNFSSAYYFVIN